MSIIIWICLGLFFLFLLIGLLEWLGFFADSWFENGPKYTLLVALFFSLVVAYPLTKEYAPQFHNYVKLSLFVYVIGFFLYRFLTGFKED